MKYLVTLKSLEPFLFGGENTFGTLGDKENGTYLVKSRMFPQQSALLGMLKKEIMTQSGVLTRKIRGEWVDKKDKQRAKELVGSEIVDKPYTGYYSINNCFINSKIKNKIENLDRYNKNFKNDISLIDAIGMSFF